MKPTKKQKQALPEVHILGDLQDVKNLIKGVNKKKTLVIFRDGDNGSFYLEIEGKFQPVVQEDIALLEKEYKLIFFLFFPSRKKAETLKEEKTEVQEAEKVVKKKKVENKEVKGKNEKKTKKK